MVTRHAEVRLPTLVRHTVCVSAGCLIVLLAACTREPQHSRDDSARLAQADVASIPPSPLPFAAPALTDLAPTDLPGLHNVVAFHDGVYSGSQPEGPESFDTLQRMGVRTIISVDGAAPDVDAAAARGIRYIHLPIGYNGVDELRRRELTRALRDAAATGDVYIHCHHGKHRSAGAAGAAAVSLGWSTPEAMVGRMKVSGTAPAYKGLYRSVTDAGVLSPQEIDAVSPDFPSVSTPQGWVRAMVEIDEIDTHLKLLEQARWGVVADHPDLVAVAEAGRLADHYRVLAEELAEGKPAELIAMMKQAHQDAQALEDLLASPVVQPDIVAVQFKLVASSCKACHVKFRD